MLALNKNWPLKRPCPEVLISDQILRPRTGTMVAQYSSVSLFVTLHKEKPWNYFKEQWSPLEWWPRQQKGETIQKHILKNTFYTALDIWKKEEPGLWKFHSALLPGGGFFFHHHPKLQSARSLTFWPLFKEKRREGGRERKIIAFWKTDCSTSENNKW